MRMTSPISGGSRTTSIDDETAAYKDTTSALEKNAPNEPAVTSSNYATDVTDFTVFDNDLYKR